MKNILYMFFVSLLIISCSSPKEQPTEADELETPIPTQNKLTTKGLISFGHVDSASVFLEANFLRQEVSVLNQKIDSLRKLNQNGQLDTDGKFVLGTFMGYIGAFSPNEYASKLDTAVELLSLVIEQSADDKTGAAFFNRGQVYALQGNWKNSKKDIQAYLGQDSLPSVYAHFILANIAYAEGDSTQMCKELNTMKEAMPNESSTLTTAWYKRCNF